MLLILGLVAAGAVILLDDKPSSGGHAAGWWCIGGAGAILLLALASASGRSKTCGVCGIQIRRSHYQGVINGKSMLVCPRCNNRFESIRSKEAVDRLTGRGRSGRGGYGL